MSESDLGSSQVSFTAQVDKPQKKTPIGISFSEDEDSILVSKIAEDSLAAESGLKVGDKITAVNGKDAKKMGSKGTASFVRKSKGSLIFTAESIDEEEPQEEEEKDEEAAELIVDKKGPVYPNEAALNTFPLGVVIGGLQIVAAYVLFRYSTYDDVSDFTMNKYTIFRDIMVMLLLGFGYLMTFLEKYGLGAVGLTMLVTALNMECNLIIEGFLTSKTGMINISMDSIINAEFSAATLLISFGALIGRASPLQMCVIGIAESVFYALNKVFIVFGVLGAEDVGGTLTIHMFGAFFGLACAYALGPQEKESASNNDVSRVSDVFSLIGTTLLWVYWPSFVGATETGDAENEMHCLINTIMALIGSTGATFFLSQYLHDGKFDAVHIQNSTLAGGVAIGATARLAMGPGVALIVGLCAGLVSVLGYDYSSPFLESKFGIFDTCGVGNLHGYPSVFGGLVSILLVFVDSNADFLNYGLGTQSIIQLLAVVLTLVGAMVTGFITGYVVLRDPDAEVEDYEDAVWWHGVG